MTKNPALRELIQAAQALAEAFAIAALFGLPFALYFLNMKA